MTRKTITALCIQLLVPALCAAQSATTQRAAPQRDNDRTSAGPPSSVGPSNGQVLVEAGETGSQVEVVFKFTNDLALTLSAPTDDDAKSTDFASLDGLADELSLEISWSRIFGQKGVITDPKVASRIEAVCRDYGLPTDENCTGGELEEFLKENDRESKIEEALDRFDRALYKNTLWWGLLINAELGHDEYEFFDNDGNVHKEDEFSRSVSVSVVRIYGTGSGRFAFGLGTERAFKDGETEVQKCEPRGDSNIFEKCKTLPLGAPADENELLARLEVRHIFSKLAIGPVISWNFETDVLGAEVPIYLARNEDQQFTGGFRLSWRSDEGDVSLSAFVGKALPLF